MKFAYVVVNENSSEESDIGQCLTKVKVLAQNFLHLPKFNLSSPISRSGLANGMLLH